MNKIVIAAVSIAAAAAIAGGAACYFLCNFKKYGETQTVTVGDGESLKVGIISDSQLPANGSADSSQIIALKKSLETMKANGVDVLLHAGDFTDLSTVEAWQSFADTYDEVYGNNKPVPVFAMGNHDYWLDYFAKSHEIATPAKLQRRFTKYTGERPFSHKVINGYHFIVWSSSDGSYDKSYSDRDWIKEQLDAAVKDDPNKPIFVVTHLNAQDTVYGSDEWGNQDIYDVLKDYPQVISFSGHSHYALCDERSIWQGEFTAINTQTTDYIELESGKYNGSIPKDAYGNDACPWPMGMIMTIDANGVSIQRIDTVTGESYKEPWIISAPFGDASSFCYTWGQRKAENKAPEFKFPVNAEISERSDRDGNEINVISFSAAEDDDFVHSYRLEFLDGSGNVLSFEKTSYAGEVEKDENDNTTVISELLYFSDFSKGTDKMSDTVELRLPPNLQQNTAKIRITAIDSWNAQSESVTVDRGGV